MISTDEGKSTLSRASQPSKQLSSIDFNDEGKTTFSRAVQTRKVPHFKDVIEEDERSTFFNETHFENAKSLISATDLVKTTFASDLQSVKACDPIALTDGGKVTSFRPVSQKASFSINVTEGGI